MTPGLPKKCRAPCGPPTHPLDPSPRPRNGVLVFNRDASAPFVDSFTAKSISMAGPQPGKISAGTPGVACFQPNLLALETPRFLEFSGTNTAGKNRRPVIGNP